MIEQPCERVRRRERVSERKTGLGGVGEEPGNQGEEAMAGVGPA